MVARNILIEGTFLNLILFSTSSPRYISMIHLSNGNDFASASTIRKRKLRSPFVCLLRTFGTGNLLCENSPRFVVYFIIETAHRLD